MNKAVTDFVVMSNGQVDFTASRQAFTQRLNQFVTAREGLRSEVAKVVHSVFDQHHGQALKTQVLIDLAMQRANVTPENYDTMTTAVRDYVHNNSEFAIRKGKGGGVFRTKDVPVK